MGYAEYSITEWKVMGDNLTLKGKLMYEKDDMLQFIKILERGLFPKGKEFVDVKAFKLEQWREAFDEAAEYIEIGKLVILKP